MGKIDDYISESAFHVKMWRMRRKVENILKIRKGNPAYSMNPMDVWYEQNACLRDFFDKYFADNVGLVENFVADETIADLEYLF